MKWNHIAIASVLASAPWIAVGCGPASAESTSPAASAPPPPPTVTVAPVESRSIAETMELTGRVRPVDEVVVRARVNGHLEKVHFQNGALVKKGDPLFTLDARWYEATLAAAKATLEQARVRVDTADREAKRAQQLVAKQAISAEEAESRTSRLADAKASLLSAEAAVAAAQLDLDYTRIVSPIDGRVDRTLVTPGNFVSGIPSASTELTTIVSVDPVYVDADLDEVTLLRVRRAVEAGQLPTDDKGRVQIELGISDEEGFPHKGVIDSMGNRIDSATGSIPLRALVANPDKRFVPGMFVRVRIPLGAAKPTVLVSERAIGTDQSQKFVLIVGNDNLVAYRPIQLGPQVGNQRVVAKGLTAGERVIVNGLQRSRPGAPVTPETETAAPTAR